MREPRRTGVLEIVDAARMLRMLFRRSDKVFKDALMDHHIHGKNHVSAGNKSCTRRKQIVYPLEEAREFQKDGVEAKDRRSLYETCLSSLVVLGDSLERELNENERISKLTPEPCAGDQSCVSVTLLIVAVSPFQKSSRFKMEYFPDPPSYIGVLEILEDNEDDSRKDFTNIASTAPRDLAECYTNPLNKKYHPKRTRRTVDMARSASFTKPPRKDFEKGPLVMGAIRSTRRKVVYNCYFRELRDRNMELFEFTRPISKGGSNRSLAWPKVRWGNDG
ncbi:hypothetical protein HOY80DRAFT_1140937 [Tuber brumale]|nr:hypothetical protein HOY80DRAFT_1140937 [Tuber brumale]